MNIRNWTKQHTIGFLIGLATTLVAIPLTIMISSAINDYTFSFSWDKFTVMRAEKSRIISLASIANLIWFHIFLRKENWPVAMGVIMATVINLIVILYFKFLA